MKESFFLILKLKGDLIWSCSSMHFCKGTIRNSSSEGLYNNKHLMSQCVYMGGRELVQYCPHINGHGKDVTYIEDML